MAGRALHFTSHRKGCAESFQAARKTAKTDEDLKEALWGEFLAITEIAPQQMPELSRSSWSRCFGRSRRSPSAGDRTLGTAEQTPSVAGEWGRFAALLDSLQYSRDPLASTSFLAMASVAARFAGNSPLVGRAQLRELFACVVNSDSTSASERHYFT